MEINLTLGLSVLFFLFIARIFLSISEASLMSVNKLTIKHLMEKKIKRATILNDLIQSSDHFLPTLLLLTLLADVAAGSLTTALTLGYLPLVGALATGALTILLFVYAELIPKSYAINNAERAALAVSVPVARITKILYPVVFIFIKIADLTNKLFGGKSIEATPFVTEEEIKTMVNVGGDEGVIEEEERELIHSIFAFGDTIVREVMVPRIDMVSVDANAPIQDAINIVVKDGHSRIPVFEKSIDNVIGIIYAKDILNSISQKKSTGSIKKLMRPAYFVPETKKLNELLRELQQKRQHMAMVVDEYGQTAGLITIEDLIEEIFGEIFDEFDLEKAPIQHIDEGKIIADSRISAFDLHDIFGTTMPDDLEVDTLGGFVVHLIGYVPKKGEITYYKNLKFTVTKVSQRRIEELIVEKIAESEDHIPDEMVQQMNADQESESGLSGERANQNGLKTNTAKQNGAKQNGNS